MAKFASLRIVLAIAAAEDMKIHAMDVSSAFLNGDLDEEIYMRQPEGFVEPDKKHLVCRLKQSLYGLKQSPRQWYKKLHETFTSLGFSRTASDHSVWIWAKDGAKIIIPVYVDDLTIACNSLPTLTKIKAELKSRYAMRDLGEISYTLGVEVHRNRASKTLQLSQRKYINVLARFNMSSARPVSTPLASNVTLSKDMSTDC